MEQKDRIILVVTGSVASYKAAELVRRLMEKGAEVRVAMTGAAEKFVSPLLFESLTGQPVLRADFPGPGEDPMSHINFSRGARLVLIAPATANTLGKLACGIAEDQVSSMLLASGLPVMAAPAMNTMMYLHPAVQENLEKLKARGVTFIGPASGGLACGEEGEGKMEDVESIVCAVMEALEIKKDLAGKRMLVTAGGSREPIDPVRFISNRSSGKMGVAIASAAARRGAQVRLVAAAMETPIPEGISVERAYTAAEMLEAVTRSLEWCDALVMAAAVADYQVASPALQKVKKDGRMELALDPAPDILAAVAKEKGRRLLVGFAAETENAIAGGRKKLFAKNLDMIVINDVSRADIGFGSDQNEVTILARTGAAIAVPRMAKAKVADIILDQVAGLFPGGEDEAAGLAVEEL